MGLNILARRECALAVASAANASSPSLRAFSAAFSASYIVGELLYPVHCAVVGEGHAGHAVGHGFVYYARDGCLAVEHGVLRVYV